MRERHGLRSPVAGRLLVVPCGRKVENLYAAISPGLVVNPARTADQVIGAPTQGTSQALIEQVIFNTSSVTSLDWVTYLVLRFKEDPR